MITDGLLGSKGKRALSQIVDHQCPKAMACAQRAYFGWLSRKCTNSEWQKFSNFELSARVPLMIAAPGLPSGIRQEAVVELVDVMPTLLELAAVPLDPSQQLDGTSLAPLMRAPSHGRSQSTEEEEDEGDGGAARNVENGGRHGTARAAERVALTLYPRCPNGNAPSADPTQWWEDNICEFVDRTRYSFVGLSIRTARWRYTEWRPWRGDHEAPDWHRLNGSELYDHDGDDGSDFDAFENTNLAGSPAHASDVQRLSELLRTKYAPAV